MIVRPRQHWFRMLFVWHGSVLSRILPQLGIVTGLAVLVTIIHGQVFYVKVPLTFVPFALIGVALAVFLGFRNSASYDRYWEGRKLWGSMLSDSRNLARQYLTLTHDTQEKKIFVYTLVAVSHALRHQLRGTNPCHDLQRLLGADVYQTVKEARFVPNILLLHLAQQLQTQRMQQAIEPILAAQMEVPMLRLTEYMGACERLSNTPLPYTYVVILHRITYLYCFLLPFGLVDAIAWTTPIMVAFIAYAFFALEALSDELEEPFGISPNDLALEAMCVTIETTLKEMLGEKELPEAVKAVDFVVL
jgi:putative membrane protein